MVRTRLVELLNEQGVFPQDWKTKEEVNQEAVDRVAPDVLSKLSPKDIVDHNIFAYSASVKEYDSKKVNSEVIPELPMFIDMMPENGLVLDLAAGHLKDTLYMVDPSSRERLNKEGVISPRNNKSLRVIPLEGSLEFLDQCEYKLVDHMSRVPLIVNGDFMNPGLGEVYTSTDSKLIKIFTEGQVQPVLDGIWSCAGQLVHMVPGKLKENLGQWTNFLKDEGLYAVSYIKRKEGQGEMKLLASRSAPGEIKVFSHYSDGEVEESFNSLGFKLVKHTNGDYDGHGFKMDDFFGSGFYKRA